VRNPPILFNLTVVSQTDFYTTRYTPLFWGNYFNNIRNQLNMSGVNNQESNPNSEQNQLKALLEQPIEDLPLISLYRIRYLATELSMEGVVAHAQQIIDKRQQAMP
jgi:hypothetical protein